MSDRDSFIFYRSFYDAISSLENPEDRELCYRAIFEYGFNQNEIELDGVPKAVFLLAKPQLEANYKKFINGKKKKQIGSKAEAKQKQNISKTEANDEQTESKTGANVNVNVNENVNVNDKKNTKKKDDFFLDVPVALKDSFMEWVDMRKRIKKPITSKRAVTLALNKLKELSDDTAVQIKIIDQSTLGCWQSFYPLKEPEVPKHESKPPAYKEFPPGPERKAEPMPAEMRAEIDAQLGKIFKTP